MFSIGPRHLYRRVEGILLGLALVAWGGTILQAEEGYQLLRDRVVVNAPEHWQAWEATEGVRVIHEDGIVEPRFLRRGINAVLNAGQFQYVSEGDSLTGGILRAGSNPADAALVIDGDMNTFWEPDPQSPLASWNLDIDLGRAVIAKRIVMRFVEEDMGDPFLKFRVLISDGLRALNRARSREHFRVGLVTQPNKDQREFVFAVEPQKRVPEGLSGEVAQIVRVEVLDTDGLRGEEIGHQEHQELSAMDQGAVDYFRQTRAGRQIRVEKEVYEVLPEEEQGRVRYYRRERPRLAEVEVHTLGDNVVPLTRSESTQRIITLDYRRVRSYTDGLLSTFYWLLEYDPVRDENRVEIDLGARYWLERVRLISPDQPPPAYQVRISDGSLDPAGQRLWRIFEERLNQEAFLQVEETFKLQEVRFIEVRRLPLTVGKKERGNLSEVQAYGEGYVSEVIMTSPLIRLQRSRLLSTLTWAGETPLGTRIEVRTRSGDRLLRIPHYFNLREREVSKTTWERLDEEDRGDVEIEELPDADWSNWSEVYLESGERFKSPSPRRYALTELRLISEEPMRAARIQQLQLHFDPPLVDQVFAEVWPLKDVPPGQEQEFTLYLRPVFGSGNPGFDRMRLRSSSSSPIELVRARVGQERELSFGGGKRLWPGFLQVERGADGAVELLFPEPVTRGGSVYALTFRTRVFLSNTLFSAQLTQSVRPDLVQEVTEGEATSLVKSQSLVVLTDLEEMSLLGKVAVVPSTFTPNGDGVNDETAIEVDIFLIEETRRLRAGVYDLAGRRLRDLSFASERPSGRHLLKWDGRDDGGRRVAPGIYAVRFGFSTDARALDTEAIRLVRVVY